MHNRNVRSERVLSRNGQAPEPRSLVKIGLIVIAVLLVPFLIYGALKPIIARVTAQKPKYTKTQTICLDPGHGGVDPGSSSGNGKIFERDINLTVAQKVRSILEAQGYHVYMTRIRNSDGFTNHDRYTRCNDIGATILVSIHHNYFTDDSADHDTALFFKDTDQPLATSILDATASKLKITNNGIVQFEDGVLSKSKMPAALSEGFFITSYAEYQQLTKPGSTRLADEAQGIAAGITNYFTEPKAAQPVVNPNSNVIINEDASQ